MTQTGYLWDARSLGHEISTIHPERPDRVRELEPTRVLMDLPGLRRIPTDRDLALPWIGRVHDPAYTQRVRTAFDQGLTALDSVRETRICQDTYEVALTAAAGALSLTSAVARGEVKNGFAAIRPPGHHAGPSYTRGFCFFNNVALCARFAQEVHGLERILILDWDAHPADGTMDIFYEDPTVHLVSVHQDGIFTDQVGRTDQIGRGAGEGCTYNLPLTPGARGKDYLDGLLPLLERAAARCRPDLILISCGFDAHQADAISAMRLEDGDYARLTREVRSLATQYCAGKIVSVLEGGYNPVAMRRATLAHLAALMD